MPLVAYADILNINPALLFVLVAWVVIWKGLALWRAARKNSKPWFVVLLVVNTIGILDILYLFLFSEMGGAKKVSKKNSRKRKR